MMPLMRDQQEFDQQPLDTAHAFTARRQQTRINHSEDPGRSTEGNPFQSDSRTPFHKRDGSKEELGDAKRKNGGKYSLEADETIGNAMKIPLPTSLPPKREKPFSHSPQARHAYLPRQSRTVTNQKIEQDQPQTSAFDNTNSFNMSFDTIDNEEDNRTVVQRPQSRASREEPKYTRQTDHSPEGLAKVVSSIREVGQMDSSFDAHVNVGRVLLHNRGLNVSHTESFSGQNEVNRRGSFDSDGSPETPSRSRSAPTHSDIIAPMPQRAVVINSSPHILNQSPVVRSEEIAGEEPPEMPQSRPSSAQMGPRRFALPQRGQQNQSKPHSGSRLRQSQTMHPARFQNIAAHLSSAHTHEQKVSAPESDVPESSEDERPASAETRSVQTVANIYIDKTCQQGKKRTRDGSISLDYDHSALEKKSLAELQNEPFFKDPREQSEPQRDALGNDLSLAQILDKWPKMSEDILRSTFRLQTDDEWAQTGQWFVDSFQADLKELMQVRFERRKVALSFEHKIRRRQREIEHSRSGLEKELRELQEGGSGLLKDRKMTTGSRSNTPIKRSN